MDSNQSEQLVKFGAHLRALREKLSYSQEAFAEKLGVHRTYLGGLERGERNPTLIMLYQIAFRLDISLSKLLAGL